MPPLSSAPPEHGPHFNLAPRDPHWLHASWALQPEQWRALRKSNLPAQVTVRLFEQSPGGRLVSETHVHPEATRWFVHVEQPGRTYAGQLGYYDTARKWTPLATAAPVRTPSNGPSSHQDFELATLNLDGTVERHGTTHTLLPSWTEEREAALRQLLRHGAPSTALTSDDSLALAGREGGLEVSSPSSFGERPASWQPSSLSSAMPAAPAAGFRLELNAELIVYGATEPGATLTIGERKIELASDGSFRFRFALPDGAYVLPVKAEARRGDDTRAATLRFSRHTEGKQGVAELPPEPGLKPPAPENC